MTETAYPDALPAGHRLHWYVIEQVLGQGGFGITYLAHDPNLDRRVAIKEYLPTEIARRRPDASARPRTESHAERYAWGLERFLSEARTLARFDHPNIVRVHSVFEANNTAYMVMRFEEGEDLASLLERRGTLPERELTDWLLPIMDGLEIVHASGFIHRDIKPENIYVRQDGSPVLLDFGSARQAFGSAKTMTILVAPGYAPLEQYHGDATTQGPWTDIYGLGATCYRAIAGRPPLDSVARAKGVLGSSREILESALEAGRGRYREPLLAAVDHALKLSERDRPQRIADWRREIVAVPTALGAAAATSDHSSELHVSVVMTEKKGRRPLTRPYVAWGAALAACALVAIVTYFIAVTRTAVPAASTTALAMDPAPMPSAPPARVASPASAAVELAVTAAPVLATAAPVPAPAVPAPKAATVTVPVIAKTTSMLPVATRPGRASDTAPRPATTTPSLVSPAERPPLPLLAADPAPSPSLQATLTTAATGHETAPDEGASSRRRRDEALDAAEAALRRGEPAAAAKILAPLAAAGVAKAQTLLGRSQEARAGGQRNDFEAYVWYGIAARSGEPGAQGLKDKVAAKLQPAEIRQADRIVEGWKPRVEAASGGGS
ncbi:MAG: protein kinase domain-containing protein [Caldimonas sp.]